MPSESETRSKTLRTITLPDCCGNCCYFGPVIGGFRCCLEAPRTLKPVEVNNHCDLHERKTEEGSDADHA